MRLVFGRSLLRTIFTDRRHLRTDMGHHDLCEHLAERAEEEPPSSFHRKVPAGRRDRIRSDSSHPDA